MMYASFVGLEVHVHLATRTKCFCGCRAVFGDEPNTNVCPVCLGYPGSLPMLNTEAVRLAYLVARALGCALAPRTLFERKNYFYPDMPKNYQISQFRSPIGVDGKVEIELRKRRRTVRIREVHLEEDAGKMIHAGDATLLDYNRAGTSLLEIVTQPDLEVGEEAEVFLQHLRRLVRWLGVSDGNMEEGSLRCDANVSINLPGQGLGSKVEVKNLNSFKFVRRALDHEIERQTEILDRGGTVRQETRLWNENRDVTEGMRTKESAYDYRYFPEPDLPPFTADASFLASVEALLVELPRDRARQFVASYGLPEAQADFLCEEKALADFFEESVHLGADPQSAALWLAADVRKHLNRLGTSIDAGPLTSARFAELLSLLASHRIHGRIAKAVLDAVFAEDKDPVAIIAEKGWEQITDRREVGRHVDAVLAANPGVVETIRGGDARPVAFLVGEIMRVTSGRADPGLVQELVRAKLAVTLVQVLSLGGAITGRFTESGDVAAGDAAELLRQLEAEGRLPGRVAFEEVELGRILSEEIAPEDWARLLAAVDEHLRQGKASGIVIAHGTDTLAWTASLLFWLFPKPAVPIVLAASLQPAGREGSDAIPTLRSAIQAAAGREPGVYVVFGGRELSPLNLRFERVAADGFRNWNLSVPVHTGNPLFTDAPALGDREAVRARLEAAINRTAVLRVYPGMRADLLIGMMNAGVRHFVLELYDTGTASLRESPYSLRRAFLEAKDRGVRFFCTSQQEGIVDFSRYVTSHELWREGAVPMGSLTTESAYMRLVACLAFSETEEEALERMQQFDTDFGGLCHVQ
jgi:aspartyl-tRNA(Asn)/glutamyl-tRNA(Gln) amidotransferase subunit B